MNSMKFKLGGIRPRADSVGSQLSTVASQMLGDESPRETTKVNKKDLTEIKDKESEESGSERESESDGESDQSDDSFRETYP